MITHVVLRAHVNDQDEEVIVHEAMWAQWEPHPMVSIVVDYGIKKKTYFEGQFILSGISYETEEDD